VDMRAVQWVTFEDGHLAEFPDPPGVIRAEPGQDITQMLIDGEIDAAIYGAAMPKDERLKSIIPEPDAAGRAWGAQHGLVPVNHMVVVPDELAAAKPEAVTEFYRLLEASKQAAGLPAASELDLAPFGEDANRPALELLISYATQQGLLARPVAVDDLW
jgi:4,5-dihydroxyphthalate decarboxylase